MSAPQRTIAVVTSARSDYGLLTPVLRQIETFVPAEGQAPLELRLIVAGSHFDPRFGETVRFVREDFPVADEVRFELGDDSPLGIAEVMSRGVSGFAQALHRGRPDLLLLLGDRYETLTAALAALPALVPVAHLHGGEVTMGAIDDSVRHALTKLSHLHFVATDEAARRVAQLGEEPWRILVSGAPGLDTIRTTARPPRSELFARLGLDPARPTLLVTYHPVTTEYARTGEHIFALLAALARIEAESGAQLLFTAPNPDTAGQIIAAAVERFCAEAPSPTAGQATPRRSLVRSTGQADYLGLLASVDVMVGNSSSGLLEAPSFELPVVNIGSRQDGRERAPNVLDCATTEEAIVGSIRRALEGPFRASLAGVRNPYGDGHAAERIVARLAEVALGETLIKKRFVDLTGPGSGSVR